MTDQALISIVASLAPPASHSSDEEVLAVAHVPARPAARVGVDQDGRPAFVLKVQTSESAPPLVPFRLPNLLVRHHVRLRLVDQQGDSIERGYFTLVQCLAEEPPLRELFIRCLGHAIPSGAAELEPVAVNSLVEHLLDLFRLSSTATPGEILGLWAEMLIIVRSAFPVRMLRAWHTRQVSHFDFGDPVERIEVKATSGPGRRHHVSYEQANPPSNVRAIFASVVTEEVAVGLSVRSLWDACLESAGTDTELIAKVDRLCIQTLGRDWPQAVQVQFDEQRALHELRFFRHNDVPRIVDLPAGVSGAQWQADFDLPQPVTWPEIAYEPEGLVAALAGAFS